MSYASGTAFLYFWLTFTGLVLLAIVAVLTWAFRSGQFSNQDYARHLPLLSGIPEEADLQERDAEFSECPSFISKEGD